MKQLFRLSILMLALILPATATAHDFEVDGIYYNKNGENATVTYKGDNLYEYFHYSGNVTIPATVRYDGQTYSVTGIGPNAFDGCGVTSVIIPNSVKYIGESAFMGCSSLIGITIPNSVTHIYSYVFLGCIGLTSVTIGNSVTSISDDAFSGCSGLTSITIPNSVTSIGSSAFYGCSGLNSVNLGDSVISIGNSAFFNCSGLTSVTIPNSVTEIGYNAFSYCSRLTSVTIPNTVTTIYGNAFSWCGGLTNITVESGNPEYDSRDNCNAIIETANNTLMVGCLNTVIPKSVTFIGGEAFSGCSGLTSIEIPNSVTSIGGSAFEGCSGLTSVTIPNSVTSIGYNVFSGCRGLTSIDIPNSVTSIGSSAFSYCYGLTSIDIPNSVTSIGGSTFSHCSGLASVTIPNSVTSIGSSAFSYCYGLASITIPNSVTSIGYSAFSGCDSLNDVYSYISDPSVITMGYSVFNQYPDNYAERTLHVPAGSLQAYQADSNWYPYFGSIVEMEPEAVLATSIELDQVNAEMVEGEALQLTATVLPEDATNRTVTWDSSNEAVATVDENGLVMAVAPGTTTITAMTNDGSDLNASCNVTVLQGIVLVESIQLNVTTAGLNEGASLQLTATVLPRDCDNKTVLWSSDDPSVATVDSNGLVTTHSVGTATITAMAADGSNLSTTCTVTLLPVGVKGDVNGDSVINIADVTKLIDYLLGGAWD